MVGAGPLDLCLALAPQDAAITIAEQLLDGEFLRPGAARGKRSLADAETVRRTELYDKLKSQGFSALRFHCWDRQTAGRSPSLITRC